MQHTSFGIVYTIFVFYPLRRKARRHFLPEDIRPYPAESANVRRPESARDLLARRVREVILDARERTRLGSPLHIQRVAVPVTGLEPFNWLGVQDNPIRIFWSGREDSEEVAGIGKADLFSENGDTDYRSVLWRLRSSIAAGEGDIRYYGGMRFDHGTEMDPLWSAFGRYRFYLPRFEVRSGASDAQLVCNLAFPRDFARMDAILTELSEMSFSTPAWTPPPEVRERSDNPDRKAWKRRIGLALAAIERGTLEKIVLARKSTFTFSGRPDAIALLARARKAMPGCFHFAIQPDERMAFVGASPERLYERKHNHVWSEAVAGTRPRGHTREADKRLATELMESDKDRREHEFVRRSIIEGIGPFSASYSVETVPSVMQLSHGQHLQARMQAALRRDVSDADLVLSLHPTPAVGGVPREASLEMIDQLESFDRGWYAGPVGWIGSEGAEFAVAIRSGLIFDNKLALYSGAGIVSGSVWEREWDEIEQKIEGFTSLFQA